MADLQVNDPVSVHSNDKDLEGVVAFTGSVDFAEGDDWVGVRLTGKSVGQGKNDGSVQGKVYFECPTACGLFVRASAVTKRALTKLEELRLRRELAAVAAAGATAGAPARPAAGASRTPPREGSAKPTTSSGAKSKLEEIRQRRAALQAKKQDPSTFETASGEKTPPRSSTPRDAGASAKTPPSPSTSIREIDELKEHVADLKEQLKSKQEEASMLQEKLSTSEEQAKEAKAKVAELQASLVEAASTEQTQSPAQESPAKAILAKSVEDVQDQNLKLQHERDELTERLDEALQEVTNLRQEINQEKKARETAVDALTQARAEATSYQKELQAVTDKSDQRLASDAVHYKERAKLQADLSALKRRIEQLERENIEMESTIEDITLDKEQLQEEKDALEDKWEELKIDAETAQMEVEELKLELQDARATAERVTGVADTLTKAAVAEAGSSPSKQQEEAADMAQALQVQNMRLRDALIRLREQSSLEKMELTRQLRAVEKDASANNAVADQVEELRAVNQNLEEQINDLKDMVEQGAAFETMVEDLSDRVMSLEEEIVAQQAVIREMEESAELTAEMEEVQADELKAMARDLEGRDTIIRNLEAIKMQRRREDDFRRTVGNYKTTVDTLKQEKEALMELQQGGEGEKSSLIASSQKALARAAQLVADAAEMRKREAQAVMDRIDHEIYKHLSNRLESLLPRSVVSAEVSAVKGEMMACKVVGKAYKSLEGIGVSFRKSIRPPLPQAAGEDKSFGSGALDLKLADDIQQQVSTMIHQTEFAQVIVDVSSNLLRFLSAGQWPDLVSQETSIELGSILFHTIPELDNMLGAVLKTLKEEGALTVEQSDVGSLRLALQNTMQNLRTDIERENGSIVPSSWNPPGWKLLRDSSLVKFSCLGAAAALSLAVDAQSEKTDSHRIISVLYNKVEQTSSQATNTCLRLACLDVKNESLVDKLSALFADLAAESQVVLTSVQELLISGGRIDSSEAAVEKALGSLAKISSILRAENMNPREDERCHVLSPEVEDAWSGISGIACLIRSIDGDADDVNYLLRARAIEYRLGEAVENEPKLAMANAKVASLEKSLSVRSKEIAMQSARLSELENLVAKSTATPVGRGAKIFDFNSSEEYNTLKEENRVLTEAMDVLQREVEMYENEIRALKDFKSPKRAAGSNRPPRRSHTDLSPKRGTAYDDVQSSTNSLEATLFRPALQEALQEAARWKTSATASAILNLPPLPVVPTLAPDTGKDLSKAGNGVLSDDYIRLSSAMAACRIEKAKVSLIDLTNTTKTPREQLREMNARNAAITERLESIMLRCRARIQ